MSKMFDDGGARGMLLNNLGLYNGCQLLFDSMETMSELALDSIDEDISQGVAETDKQSTTGESEMDTKGHRHLTNEEIQDTAALLSGQFASSSSFFYFTFLSWMPKI